MDSGRPRPAVVDRFSRLDRLLSAGRNQPHAARGASGCHGLQRPHRRRCRPCARGRPALPSVRRRAARPRRRVAHRRRGSGVPAVRRPRLAERHRLLARRPHALRVRLPRGPRDRARGGRGRRRVVAARLLEEPERRRRRARGRRARRRVGGARKGRRRRPRRARGCPRACARRARRLRRELLVRRRGPP